MSKVLLINRAVARPNKEFHVSRRKWQPLNLLDISSFLLASKIPVKIVDARAMDYSIREVEKIIIAEQPQVVLVASDPFDFYQCPNPSLDSFYQLLALVRKIGVKYVLSIGPQATIFDKKLLEENLLDYIIKGDDPKTAAGLIEALLNKKPANYVNVSSKDGAQVNLGEIKHLEDLDSIPVAHYELLPMARYAANMPDFSAVKFSVMSTSRGCPFGCKYCFKSLIGFKIRQANLPRIKSELDELVIKHQIKAIYFLDDFFTFSRERVLAICQLIINQGYDIVWGCQTRPDYVDEEILKKMKESGCIYISYGVESGCPEVATRSGKSLDLKKTQENIDLTRACGIKAHINSLYGFPGETIKEFNQTIDFLIKNREASLPGAIRFYPGCAYYNQLIPGKSVAEVEKISLDLSLSALKTWDVEKGLARLIIKGKLRQQQYDWRLFYFLVKYFFPKLTTRFKKFLMAKEYD
ncbi:MAG: B12-binding domain-containing radical SAM protein [Candidatus Buchananbacteria bacterium]